MKEAVKFLLVACVTLGLVTEARAMQAGPQVGFNIAGFGGVGGATAANETKFMLGGFLETDLAPMFYFQPELLFLGAGGNRNYLAVPLLLKLKLETGSEFLPFVVAGPDFMLKLSGTATKSINFSLDFGAGFEMQLAPLASLVISGRYSLGLADINDPTNPASDLKTKGIHVLVGLALGV